MQSGAKVQLVDDVAFFGNNLNCLSVQDISGYILFFMWGQKYLIGPQPIAKYEQTAWQDWIGDWM